MNSDALALAEICRKDARSGLERYVPRIVRCLQLLSEKEIWWPPNDASNAAGNIVLHLCGNIRQWIISGLGGEPDVRAREKEFGERGPISRRMLIAQLKAARPAKSSTDFRLKPCCRSSEFKATTSRA